MSKSCSKCGYKWESRIEDPKSCPRCKQRLDTKYVREFKEKQKHVL